ncbi:MAG: hypothetical protein GX804_04860 [Lentisphaerae bacterium]|nr:hypothetical protein [Lentisphaerota bacterium]
MKSLSITLLSTFFLVSGCATRVQQIYSPPPVQRVSAVAGSGSRPAPKPVALPASAMPRVMIIVDEKSLGTIATAEVEAMAVRKMISLNIPVVDQDMVRANIAKGQQMLIAAGDNRGAAALGAQFGADIVLIGEAVAKPSARRISDTNLRSYQAVATLRAVRTDNSTTLAAASDDVTVVGLEDVSGSAKALRGAGEKVLDTLLPDMLARWAPAGAGGTGADTFDHYVDMTVGGVDQMWKLKALRDTLRGRTSELRDVAQRSYTAGVAEFSMESALPTEELAELLVMSPPDGLKLQILDIGSGKIQARAVVP